MSGHRLRKRKSYANYNELQQQPNRGTNVNNNIAESVMPPNCFADSSHVPEVLYANDGRKFYPCKYCCRAFAYKNNLEEHSRVCKYRIVQNTIKAENTKNNNTAKVGNRSTVDGVSLKNSDFTNREDIKCLLKNKEISIRPAKKVEQKDVELLEVVDLKGEFACKICSQLFENALDLLRHKRHKHNYEKIKLPGHQLMKYDQVFKQNGGGDCPLCMKPILNKGGWSRHLHTHDADVKHFCKVCKKGFYRVDHKRDHEKRHIVKVQKQVNNTL